MVIFTLILTGTRSNPVIVQEVLKLIVSVVGNAGNPGTHLSFRVI